MLPEFLIRKDWKINASALTEKWFKLNKPEIFKNIEKNIKSLFPKNYKAKKYSEYLYLYFYNLKTTHLCKNPKCKNIVSKFINLEQWYKDYCSKSCYWEHYNEFKNKEKEIDSNKKRKEKLEKLKINNKLDVDFYKKDWKIDANKTKESRIKKYKPIIYNSIIKNSLLIKENLLFTAKLFLYLNNLQEIPKCKICKKELTFKWTITKWFWKYCNNICSVQDKETHKKWMDKYKKELQNRYWENITSYFQTEEFKRKKEKTSFKKYSTQYPCQSKEIKQKIEDSIISKYWSKKELWKITYKKSIETIEKKYWKNFRFDFQTSKPELELKYFINKTNIKIKIINNDNNILNWKELDIYLPEYKLAIEYNGLMWHSIWKHRSSKFNNYFLESKIKNKHLYKTEECRKQKIQLLHIFENEWIDKIKQEIWKNIIINKLWLNKQRIYWRNTYIKLVSNKLSKDFLNRYHLQWNTPSKLKIWLFDKQSNDLLSIMTFWKSRFDKRVDWELLRFSTKNWYNIIWWASKIFKYFVNNYLEDWQTIKTYADLRFSNWDIYKKLWFELVWQSKPNYFYFKNWSYKLESRQSFQKHKLKDKLEKFNPNLSESQNMYNNNYRKIYDCGNLVFIYKE